MYKDTDLKFIIKKEIYPENANYPTTIEEYECPCGKGKVLYSYVSGFRDYWVEICCKDCEEKYQVVTGQGALFSLVEKNRK